MRLGDAVEREKRLGPILDGLRIAWLQRKGLLIGAEGIVVVAELAMGVTDVVPRLVHLRIQLHGLLELAQRHRVVRARRARGLIFLGGVRQRGRGSLEVIGFTHIVDGDVVGQFRLVLGVLGSAAFCRGRDRVVPESPGGARSGGGREEQQLGQGGGRQVRFHEEPHSLRSTNCCVIRAASGRRCAHRVALPGPEISRVAAG